VTNKTAKQAALDLIEHLPEGVSTETIVAELLFKQSVIEGLGQLNRGEVVSHDEARERLAPWLRSSGRSAR
jgi:predicted transcriptional regulator